MTNEIPLQMLKQTAGGIHLSEHSLEGQACLCEAIMLKLSPIAEKIPLSMFKSSLSSISFEMAIAIVVAARVSCSPGIHLKLEIEHHLCLFYATGRLGVIIRSTP